MFNARAVYISLGLLIATMVAYILFTALVCVEAHDINSQVYELIEELEYLHEKGVDISEVVRDLNEVLGLLESGEIDRGLVILEQVRSDVERLKSVAETVYLYKMAIKFGSVIALSSIPVLVYFLLPRLYLYLWYRTHKHWHVRW